MRCFSILCAFLLTACSQLPEQSDPPTDQAISTEEASLFGQWKVVSIRGVTPEYVEMILLFGDDWWHTQSQCVFSNGDYRLREGQIDFAPIARQFEDYDPMLAPPPAMCARGLSEAERLAPQILSGVRDFDLEKGTLTIRAAEGDLVAEPLEETVNNPMGFTHFDGAATWGAWQIDMIEGVSLLDAQMVLTFDRLTIRLGCAFYQWARPKDNSGMYTPLVRRKPFRTGCDHDPNGAETELFEAMDDIEFSTQVGPDGRIMQAGGKSIRLSR